MHIPILYTEISIFIETWGNGYSVICFFLKWKITYNVCQFGMPGDCKNFRIAFEHLALYNINNGYLIPKMKFYFYDVNSMQSLKCSQKTCDIKHLASLFWIYWQM